MTNKLCPYCGSEVYIIDATHVSCNNEGCCLYHIAFHREQWNRRHVRTSADFLWPAEKGSVEEAGYEFANAKTSAYQVEWWKTLLRRVKEIELIKEADNGK